MRLADDQSKPRSVSSHNARGCETPHHRTLDCSSSAGQQQPAGLVDEKCSRYKTSTFCSGSPKKLFGISDFMFLPLQVPCPFWMLSGERIVAGGLLVLPVTAARIFMCQLSATAPSSLLCNSEKSLASPYLCPSPLGSRGLLSGWASPSSLWPFLLQVKHGCPSQPLWMLCPPFWWPSSRLVSSVWRAWKPDIIFPVSVPECWA